MRKFLWFIFLYPIKFGLSLFSEQLYNKFKRRILDCTSYIGYTNSLGRLDKALIEFFEFKRNGVCLEIGAADGIDQSNSLLLERVYEWTTYLVEPVASQFEICRFFRKNAIIDNYALVSKATFEHTKSIQIRENSLKSKILTKTDIDNSGESFPANSSVVSTKTLDMYIEERNISKIDLFVLDVEGYEREVLDGFTRNNDVIDFLLVEAWDFDGFKKYADDRGWRFITKLGVNQDYLFDLRPRG